MVTERFATMLPELDVKRALCPGFGACPFVAQTTIPHFGSPRSGLRKCARVREVSEEREL